MEAAEEPAADATAGEAQEGGAEAGAAPVRCKALYDYQAAETGYTGLVAGARGARDGPIGRRLVDGLPAGRPTASGLFPSSYVEVIADGAGAEPRSGCGGPTCCRR